MLEGGKGNVDEKIVEMKSLCQLEIFLNKNFTFSNRRNEIF